MNDSNRFADRRHVSRVNAPLPITLHTSQWCSEGEIRDIGPGGAFVLSNQKPGLEETILISFKADPAWEPAGMADQPLRIKARVIRTTAEGFAVRFVELSDAERRFLYQVVTDWFRVEFGERFIAEEGPKEEEEWSVGEE